MAILRRARRALDRPIDGASLAVFRVAFGLLMAWEVVRYLGYDRLRRYWVEPAYHFHYPGFDWVRPLPEPALTAVWVVLGLLALCIAAGAAYRLSSAVFTLGFVYFFLLEPATYLNHLYLVCLVAGLLAAAPAHRLWSVDALRRPGWAREQVPAAGLLSLRALVALVYFFAALAKCNPDWLQAQPLLIWMEERRDLPVLGPLLAWDPTAWAMSYAGLALDLAAAPLLLWRRTRVAAVAVLAGFHLINATVFDIGIFPWMMLAADLLFLSPDWPRRLLRLRPALPGRSHRPAPRAGNLVLALFFAVQVAVPLRHLAYPGRPSWSEEGHWFAWHMKLRTKRGRVRFHVDDLVDGSTEIVYLNGLLSERQDRKARGHPELLRQLAWHVREQAEADGRSVRVRVENRMSLNGRPPQAIIDPEADLSREPWTWAPAPWIVPLAHPLPAAD